jgi:DNA-directed RNA polymerase subunit RPC12/RpoP
VDHRCPLCARDLAARRLSQAIIARMEIDCPHCKRRIRLNVHRLEEALLLATFAGFVVLAALGYWLDRKGFFLGAFGAALLGAGALPLAERVWLRTWPRYVPANSGSGS